MLLVADERLIWTTLNYLKFLFLMVEQQQFNNVGRISKTLKVWENNTVHKSEVGFSHD